MQPYRSSPGGPGVLSQRSEDIERYVGITPGAPGTDPHAHLWERVTPNARGSVLPVERKMFAVPSGDSVTSLCHGRHLYLSQKPAGSDRDRSDWPERTLGVLRFLTKAKLVETL